jgi:hypothetical protein
MTLTGVLRRHHQSPAQAEKPAGQDPERAFDALRGGSSGALFQAEVQSFLEFPVAGGMTHRITLAPGKECEIARQRLNAMVKRAVPLTTTDEEVRCSKMGLYSSEAAEPRKGVWSARFSPISSCIMRSISGWRGRFPACPDVGMRMMGWCIAGTRKRRRSLEKPFKLDLLSAAWYCIIEDENRLLQG